MKRLVLLAFLWRQCVGWVVMLLCAAGLAVVAIWPTQIPAADKPKNRIGVASKEMPNAAARFIIESASIFQLQASCDCDVAFKKFGEGGCFEFLTKSPAYRTMPLAWAYFFTNTTVMVGNLSGPVYVVAFYNPFVDAAVISQWRLGAKGKPPRAIRAALWSGSELAAGRTSDRAAPPRWLTAGKPVGEALAEQHQGFVNDFIKKFPPNAQTPWGELEKTSSATLAAVAAQARLGMLQLHLVQNGPDKTLSAVVRNFRTAWAAGDRAKLDAIVPKGGAVTPSLLTALPKALRQNVVPVFAIIKDEEALLFMADPTLLRFTTMVQFELASQTRLKSVNFVDLMSDLSDNSAEPGKKGS